MEARILPTVAFTVAFDDPGASQAAYYAGLEQNLLAAGAEWAQYLDGTASIEVVITFSSDVPTANGGSATSVLIGKNNGVNIFQQGAAAEISTGVDPNGASPDVRITIGTDYLRNELWLDPSPSSNTEPIPANKTDAVSVLTHELGHALGFNGFASDFNGTLPGDYESPYDALVTFDGSNLYFIGAEAMAAYGGPVPLTFGNHFHVGNNPPRPGGDLIPDIMNGVVFNRGVRYAPSALDLAILRDAGLPVVATPPDTRQPPVLGGAGTLDYAENAPAAAIAPSLTVNDADSATLVSATITLTNFVAGQDQLAFTGNSSTMGNIAVTANANGLLTLTSAGGAATLAQWQAALRAVTYANASENPDTTSRSVSFVVNDGTNPGNVVIGIIRLTAVNDRPVLTADTLSIGQGQTVVLGTDNLNAVDPDNTAAQLIYTVSNVTGGRFELAAQPGVAITTFTQADVSAGAVRFVHTGGQARPGYAVSVSDGSLASAASTATVNFTPITGISLIDGTLYAAVPAGTRVVTVMAKRGRKGAADQLIVKVQGRSDYVVNASQVDTVVVSVADSRTRVKVAKSVAVPVLVDNAVNRAAELDEIYASLDQF